MIAFAGRAQTLVLPAPGVYLWEMEPAPGQIHGTRTALLITGLVVVGVVLLGVIIVVSAWNDFGEDFSGGPGWFGGGVGLAP